MHNTIRNNTNKKKQKKKKAAWITFVEKASVLFRVCLPVSSLENFCAYSLFGPTRISFSWHTYLHWRTQQQIIKFYAILRRASVSIRLFWMLFLVFAVGTFFLFFLRMRACFPLDFGGGFQRATSRCELRCLTEGWRRKKKEVPTKPLEMMAPSPAPLLLCSLALAPGALWRSERELPESGALLAAGWSVSFPAVNGKWKNFASCFPLFSIISVAEFWTLCRVCRHVDTTHRTIARTPPQGECWRNAFTLTIWSTDQRQIQKPKKIQKYE